MANDIVLVCTVCGREHRVAFAINSVCNAPQTNGQNCTGLLSPLGPKPVKPMTGEELYAMYERAHLRQNCGIDAYDNLSMMDIAVWEDLASQLQAKT